MKKIILGLIMVALLFGCTQTLKEDTNVLDTSIHSEENVTNSIPCTILIRTNPNNIGHITAMQLNAENYSGIRVYSPSQLDNNYFYESGPCSIRDTYHNYKIFDAKSHEQFNSEREIGTPTVKDATPFDELYLCSGSVLESDLKTIIDNNTIDEVCESILNVN